MLKLDVKRREYDIIVIGEEPHLAYNRVGLTSFFQHREVENLYLNPREWVSYIEITIRRAPLMFRNSIIACRMVLSVII